MESISRDWYVVYSKRNKETQAQFHLGMKGVESFFPRLMLPGTKPRIVPLFPNYLFVRIDVVREAHHVTWTPGVSRFVTFSDIPVPLDEAVVQFLMEQADESGIIRGRSQLKRGQEVEIATGPFAGLLGIIENPPDAQGRVKVLLNLMNRQLAVKLGIECIRGNWDGLVTLLPSAPALS